MPYLGKSPARGLVGSADIDADVITEAKMANDAIGLPELKAGTDGELITWDASGNPAAVAVGTATHVLTSNGAGAAPTFQAVGGIWDLKASGSYTGATAASIEFTSLTHDLYILYIWNMSFSDDQPLMITYSYNNGTHYANDTAGLASNDTKRYWYSTINAQKTDGSNDVEARQGIQTGEVDITAFSGAGSSGVNDMVPASAANLMGTIIIDRKADGENTLSKQGFADFLYHPAGYAPIRCNSAFMHTPSGTLGDMDAFKIFPDAGATIAGAHWKLYGTSV